LGVSPRLPWFVVSSNLISEDPSLAWVKALGSFNTTIKRGKKKKKKIKRKEEKIKEYKSLGEWSSGWSPHVMWLWNSIINPFLYFTGKKHLVQLGIELRLVGQLPRALRCSSDILFYRGLWELLLGLLFRVNERVEWQIKYPRDFR
jgi:hypothetical protein